MTTFPTAATGAAGRKRTFFSIKLGAVLSCIRIAKMAKNISVTQAQFFLIDIDAHFFNLG